MFKEVLTEKSTYLSDNYVEIGSICYSFRESELTPLIRQFVKKKTGYSLNLNIDHSKYMEASKEQSNVYKIQKNVPLVSWQDTLSVIHEFLEYERQQDKDYVALNLSRNSSDDIKNRDNIFSQMFNVPSENICYEYSDNHYKIFISTPHNNIGWFPKTTQDKKMFIFDDMVDKEGYKLSFGFYEDEEQLMLNEFGYYNEGSAAKHIMGYYPPNSNIDKRTYVKLAENVSEEEIWCVALYNRITGSKDIEMLDKLELEQGWDFLLRSVRSVEDILVFPIDRIKSNEAYFL